MKFLALAWVFLTLPLFAQMKSPETIVAAADRSEADRARDAIREPAGLLTFAGLKEGMRAADLGAGGGYTTELVVRAVGKTGTVYLQNPASWKGFVDKPLAERLAKPVMAGTKRLDSDFEDPLPGEAKNLDAVLMVLIYHDVCNMPVDRAVMNKAIFDALKPGGIYIVVDHRAKEGAGTTATKTIHRIEEKTVRAEIEAAGFEFVAESDFLSDSKDGRDTMAFVRPVQPSTDRFALKYRKPK